MFRIRPTTVIAQIVWKHWTKNAARPIDKKYLKMTSPPEQLTQIKNDFKEMFLMMPFTKIDQNV